jgi:hypothetical protein
MNKRYRLTPAAAALFLAAVFSGCPVAVTGRVAPEFTLPVARPGYFIGADGMEWPKGDFYVAPWGQDYWDGSEEYPFATLARAHEAVPGGGTVYIRGGVYYPSQAMLTISKPGSVVEGGVRLTKFFGYPGERPIFDCINWQPKPKAELGNYNFINITAPYVHLKNFEVIHMPDGAVPGSDGTGSTIRIAGANSIVENVAVHDGGYTGFWVDGTNGVGGVLLLNCDAYYLWDRVSEYGAGEDTDGFGFHYSTTGTAPSIARGCRAWVCADDGWDAIFSNGQMIWEYNWSFQNGFGLKEFDNPNSGLVEVGNGTGFKAGGHDMAFSTSRWPASQDVAANHIIRYNLSVGNRLRGFYANHHLAWNWWYNNTAYDNDHNFNMTNRDFASGGFAQDLKDGGEGHILMNNVSFRPRVKGGDLAAVNRSKCTIAANSWDLADSIGPEDFQSLDINELKAPRKPDGSLPGIRFLVPSANSRLRNKGVDLGPGYPYKGKLPDLGFMEY